MEIQVDHEQLDDALRRCGATWDAAQSHGLLSGRLAIAGAGGGFSWVNEVLEGSSANDALRGECELLLGALFESTYRQLAERQSEFQLLLPDDGSSAEERAAALAHWCEGFLHGLVSAHHGEALRRRLASEPLADVIRDMLQITRAVAGEEGEREADEQAYAELVEYLRVAAQLAYEELVEFRDAGDAAADGDDEREALH